MNSSDKACSLRRSLFQSPWRSAGVAAGVLGVVLLGWQAYATQVQLRELQQTLTHRVQAGDVALQESQQSTRQSQESLAERVATLELHQADLQNKEGSLDSLYQELSRTRHERVLLEADQAVTMAVQQLELAGNVEAALRALRYAEERLARSGDARWLMARRALTADMERLQALPAKDVVAAAHKLDGLVMQVEQLPLAFEEKPQDVADSDTSEEPSWLGRLWGEIWHEVRHLVSIERLDRPDPLWLSPDHTLFLRENLKLRLLNARLALLQQDSGLYQSDLLQAQQWLERYFSTRSQAVIQVLASLKELQTMPMVVLPDLHGSVAALKGLLGTKDSPVSPPVKPVAGKTAS